MMSFLAAHFGTIAVLAVLIAVVALIIRSIVNDHKSGKGCADCHAACGGCAHAASCSAAGKQM